MNRRGLLAGAAGGIVGLLGLGAANASVLKRPKRDIARPARTETPVAHYIKHSALFREEMYLCRSVDMHSLTKHVGGLVDDLWAVLCGVESRKSPIDGFLEVCLKYKVPAYQYHLALYGSCKHADILACMK
jgi:hypothetical protein